MVNKVRNVYLIRIRFEISYRIGGLIYKVWFFKCVFIVYYKFDEGYFWINEVKDFIVVVFLYWVEFIRGI